VPHEKGSPAKRPGVSAQPAQHPDEHRPEHAILLAVDQQLGERPALLVAPELADPLSTVKVREHEDAK
jgi:hypothetical protein